MHCTACKIRAHVFKIHTLVFGSQETRIYNTLLNPNFVSEFQLIKFYFSLYNAQVDDVINVDYAE